jgi:hypothetical protein
MTSLPEQYNQVLEMIAKKHFPGLETLETRNSDSLDFHDVSVWAIKKALTDAFFAGATVGLSLSSQLEELSQ